MNIQSSTLTNTLANQTEKSVVSFEQLKVNKFEQNLQQQPEKLINQNKKSSVQESLTNTAELVQKIGELNQRLNQSSNHLQFEIDQSSDRLVVKVVDTQKGEVVKQFPSEAFLAQSARIKEFLQNQPVKDLNNIENKTGQMTSENALGILLSEKI